jgi:large-conductance mechanosensitive channel
MIQEFKKFAVKSKVIDLAAYGYFITVEGLAEFPKPVELTAT